MSLSPGSSWLPVRLFPSLPFLETFRWGESAGNSWRLQSLVEHAADCGASSAERAPNSGCCHHLCITQWKHLLCPTRRTMLKEASKSLVTKRLAHWPFLAKMTETIARILQEYCRIFIARILQHSCSLTASSFCITKSCWLTLKKTCLMWFLWIQWLHVDRSWLSTYPSLLFTTYGEFHVV